MSEKLSHSDDVKENTKDEWKENTVKIVNPLSPAKKKEDIKTVLYAIAGQGGADGYPYNQIQEAADYIKSLEYKIKFLEEQRQIKHK